jgi:hypothetical protein
MAGARLDDELHHRIRQLAVERERNLAVAAGDALRSPLLADQLHLGTLQRRVAVAEHLDGGGEPGPEHASHGWCGPTRLRRSALQRFIQLDNQRAARGSAQGLSLPGSHARHHDGRARRCMGSQRSHDLDSAEVLQPIKHRLFAQAWFGGCDHVLAIARADSLATTAEWPPFAPRYFV